MTAIWFLILGLLFAGYFALAGTDYGVGMQLPLLSRRRDALNALGPFFLGNEVWVVAAIGVLIGAFPRLEGELLAGQYALLIPIVLGLGVMLAGVMLRSRGLAAAQDQPVRLDRVIAVASAVVAVGWGMVLGNLLIGVTGAGSLFGWFPALCGLAVAVLFTYHGSVFLAWRSPDAATAATRARSQWPVAAGLFVFVAVVAALQSGVRAQAGRLAGVAVALLVAAGLALVVSRVLVRRPLAAWLCSGLAVALIPMAVGLLRYPVVLISASGPAASLTVTEGVAGADTLRLLNAVALPWLPVLLAVQGLAWFTFARRRRSRSASAAGDDEARMVAYW